jgi:Tfp pilus assembly protein PilF
VHRPDFEKAKSLYANKEMKTLLEKFGKIIPCTTRIQAAYEYFVNDDKEKGRKLLDKAITETEKYPNLGYRIMEKEYCLHLYSIINATEE